jgi:hypothetical protein
LICSLVGWKPSDALGHKTHPAQGVNGLTEPRAFGEELACRMELKRLFVAVADSFHTGPSVYTIIHSTTTCQACIESGNMICLRAWQLFSPIPVRQ